MVLYVRPRYFSLLCAFLVQSLAQHLPLPPLPYEYHELEPYVDEATLRIHHLGHQAASAHQLNQALEEMRSGQHGDVAHDVAKMGVDTMLQHLDKLKPELQARVRAAGGGFVNHELFFNSMGPWGGPYPLGQTPEEVDLAEALTTAFGSVDAFKAEFTKAALSVKGSGWAWLVYDQQGDQLTVQTTANQDSPGMVAGHVPVLALDVWEHAYYLKYQNRRAAFVQNFWEVLDWEAVGLRLALARGKTVPETHKPPSAAARRARRGLLPVDQAFKTISPAGPVTDDPSVA